jgi:hypothetical protein
MGFVTIRAVEAFGHLLDVVTAIFFAHGTGANPSTSN